MKMVENHGFRCIPEIPTHCILVVIELAALARRPREGTRLRVGDEDLGLWFGSSEMEDG